MRYLFHFTIICVFLITGCNDEDSSTPNPTSVDISEAVGTYSDGALIVYDLQGEVLAELDKSFTVSKGSDNSTIKIDIEGDVIIGEKIIGTNDGFVFDIVEGSWSAYYITNRKSFYNNGSVHSGQFYRKLFDDEDIFSTSFGISQSMGGDVYVYYSLVGFKD
jgi:hypothetical protein